MDKKQREFHIVSGDIDRVFFGSYEEAIEEAKRIEAEKHTFFGFDIEEKGRFLANVYKGVVEEDWGVIWRRSWMNRKLTPERRKAGYFPLLIEYQDDKEKMVVESQKGIDNGRSFKVLETNYSGIL